MEINESCLPELLCVNRAPCKLSLENLLLPALESAEFMVILIEMIKEIIELSADVLVNPGTILQLHDNVKSIHH